MEEQLQKALGYWAEAGEKPYEVLIEEGIYDFFIDHLLNSSLKLNGCIYRGTRRHADLEIGEKLLYTYPTSWTYNKNIAKLFVEESQNGVILILCSKNPIQAIENHQNSHGEDELVVNPLSLEIVNKYEDNGLIILEVTPQ